MNPAETSASAVQAGELVFPTTVGQKRFWSLDALQPGNPALNMPLSARLDGTIDRAALQRSLDEILRRHEILRTHYESENGEIVQVVGPECAAEVRWIDCTAVPPEAVAAKIEAVKLEEGSRSFDLSRGPFLKAAVATFSPTLHVLTLTMHHIGSDGWSNGILFREFAENYSRIVRGELPPYDDLPLQYADFAVWQKDWLAGPEGAAQKQFWAEQLGTEIPVLNLPTDRPRSRKATVNGTIHSRLLSLELSERFRQVCQRENATPFMGYLAAYVMLLHRYSGRDGFVIGSPAACRNQTELEGMIGLFANPVLFRPRLRAGMTFRELLHQVRDDSLANFARQEYPFEILAEELRAEEGRRGVPWLQAYFIFQKAFLQPQHMPGLELEPLRSISTGAMFEWMLGLVERSEGVRLQLEYNTDLFEGATADRALLHLERIVAEAAAKPDFAVGGLHFDEIRPRLSAQPVDGQLQAGESLLDRIAAAFGGNESAVILKAGNQTLRLSELRTYTGQVKAAIEAQIKEPGQRIQIGDLGSLVAASAIIAVWESGHIPVAAPDGQGAEIAATLAGSLRSPVVQPARKSAPRSGPGRVISLRNDLLSGSDSAVDISVETLFAQGKAMSRVLGVTANERVLVSSALDSLAGWEELLTAWMGGATAMVRDGRDGFDKTVTILFMPSSLASEIARLQGASQENAFGAAWLVVLDRDPISPAAEKLLSTKCALQRVQPREIGLTVGLQNVKTASGPTAVFLALPQWNIDIVDRAGVPSPAGVPGRLRVAGAGLSSGEMVTGDWMRVRNDNALCWLGHADDLARTPGFVLELHEIAETARSIPGISDALAVMARGKTGSQLVLHVVSAGDRAGGMGDVAGVLTERLPAYMQPAAVAVHENIPRTRSGSIDYEALRGERWLAAAPQAGTGSQVAEGGAAPRGEIETRLAALFSELLRLREVDVRRSFFDLGGHSLLGVKLFARIEKEFQRRLPLSTLLTSSSVRALAQRLDQPAGAAPQWSCLVPIQAEGIGPRFFCVHGAGGNVLLYRDLARYMAPAVRFYGLQAQGLDGHSVCLTNVEDMAALYLREILAEQCEGPFYLGGYCMGGNIAFEIARLLRQRGHKVGLVAMLDTYNLRKSQFSGSAAARARILLQKGNFHVDTLLHLSFSEQKVYAGEKLRMALELAQGRWRAVRRSRKLAAQDEAGARLVAFVQSANHVALTEHDPQPLDVDVTLFRPRKNYYSFPDPRMGWGDLVSRKLDSVIVTTNPHAMLIEPFVRKLAAELTHRILPSA